MNTNDAGRTSLQIYLRKNLEKYGLFGESLDKAAEDLLTDLCSRIDTYLMLQRAYKNRHFADSEYYEQPFLYPCPLKHAKNCAMHGEIFSKYESCVCHWQVEYNCPNCHNIIKNISEHIAEGKNICLRQNTV